MFSGMFGFVVKSLLLSKWYGVVVCLVVNKLFELDKVNGGSFKYLRMFISEIDGLA